MNETIQRYKTLADRLYALTMEKKLRWNTDNFEGDLRCELSKYYIVLQESQDADGDTYISVIIKSQSNNIIDSFTGGALSQVYPDNKLMPTYCGLLDDIYRQASRQASGADEVIDEILDDLLDREVPF